MQPRIEYTGVGGPPGSRRCGNTGPARDRDGPTGGRDADRTGRSPGGDGDTLLSRTLSSYHPPSGRPTTTICLEVTDVCRDYLFPTY